MLSLYYWQKSENLSRLIEISKGLQGQRDSFKVKALALHITDPSLVLDTAYEPPEHHQR